jgi:hypothetical protein
MESVMKRICIRNPLSNKDLMFSEDAVKRYFSLYYYGLFGVIVAFHHADVFSSNIRTLILVTAVLIPAIAIAQFLKSNSEVVAEGIKPEQVIYTSLPALLMIYSALIAIQVFRILYLQFWG